MRYLRDICYSNREISDFLNISNIRLGKYDRYWRPYTITLESSLNNFAMVFNDCSEELSCYNYCNMHVFKDSDFFSCLVGCNTYIDYGFCLCTLNSTQLTEYYYSYDILQLVLLLF